MENKGEVVSIEKLFDQASCRFFYSVIVNFEEKPDNPKTNLIGTAIYFFPRRDLDLIDSYNKSKHKGNSFGYFIRFLHEIEDVYKYENGKYYHSKF
jgi:dTDP-glucose pyrophosphorylase